MNKKIIYTSFISIFILIAGFGFILPIINDGHHHESGCPFMMDEQSVCTMTPLDHFVVWQKIFISFIPKIFILIPLLFYSLILLSMRFNPPDKFIYIPSEQKNPSIPPSLFQQLFSKGILNPKAP